jgi:hypothetical protein
MLTPEQQAKVSAWVKKACAAAFNGKVAGDAESAPALSSSSASFKAQRAKKDADTASVMHLFGN